MPNNNGQNQNWWSTIPGTLTAIAGLITAVGALIFTLHSVGFFKTNENKKISTQKEITSMPVKIDPKPIKVEPKPIKPILVINVQQILDTLAPLKNSDRIDKDGSKHAIANSTFQYIDGMTLFKIETSNDDASNSFDYHLEINLLDSKGNLLINYNSEKYTMKSKSQIAIGDIFNGKVGKAVNDSRNGSFGPLDKTIRIRIKSIKIKLVFD